MSLLVDLRLVAVRQEPDAMMHLAYRIFAGGPDAARTGTQYVPHEIIVMPAMRPYL